MASLNLSTNGPSISKSYQSVLNSPPPSGAAAASPTYGQWAVFSVSAPLANAFQQDTGGKESVLKVQSTGEGELVDLIDEFSDGKIQFAFAKVKDPNTTLAKSVLIGWCGEGVPERTKGYFTSHQAAVSKTLQGYHVQISARSDRDLTPELIIQKVSEASGSKYGGGSSAAASASGPPPPVSSKPAFTPTVSSAGGGSFNPLASSRSRTSTSQHANVDSDGWGEDAPPVTRTQLERVAPAYQKTKVDLRGFDGERPESSTTTSSFSQEPSGERSDVVKGGYQPVGKVDIAAIRRQAQQQSKIDDRPEPVKGAYEPVGKVDIAAIRAKAQPAPTSSTRDAPSQVFTAAKDQDSSPSSSAFTPSERLTSLPKPKVSNRFGAEASSFTGTKAPTPGSFGLESKPVGTVPPTGVGRTFADQGGKTPAQLWAEKKARERGQNESEQSVPVSSTRDIAANEPGKGGEWKSTYQGKSWAPVQTTRTGQSAGSVEAQNTGEREENPHDDSGSAFGGVGALRDRFKAAPPPMPASEIAHPAPPPLDTSNKPNAGQGIPMPGLAARPSGMSKSPAAEEEAPSMPSPPPQPPRSPTPPTPPAVSGSPIRIARPVGRGLDEEDVQNARDEQTTPPPIMPTRSLAQAVPHEDSLTDEPSGHDPARAAAVATAAATFGSAEESGPPAREPAPSSGRRAVAQYDYDKAEDNELELKEGEEVINIEMVDEDWWMGENSRGETGLFPSNYVELVEEEEHHVSATPGTSHVAHQEPAPASETAHTNNGPTATAIYEYEAGEDNELSFPENAKITGIEFPDEDWWSGEYGGRQGLFPSNYVQLDEHY